MRNTSWSICSGDRMFLYFTSVFFVVVANCTPEQLQYRICIHHFNICTVDMPSKNANKNANNTLNFMDFVTY